MKDKAYREGVMAAHERVTPLCPYSAIYNQAEYSAWYAGFADERRAIRNKK